MSPLTFAAIEESRCHFTQNPTPHAHTRRDACTSTNGHTSACMISRARAAPGPSRGSLISGLEVGGGSILPSVYTTPSNARRMVALASGRLSRGQPALTSRFRAHSDAGSEGRPRKTPNSRRKDDNENRSSRDRVLLHKLSLKNHWTSRESESKISPTI